jgi:peptidoglycan/LPS O-acetylase OafA/YrhL
MADDDNGVAGASGTVVAARVGALIEEARAALQAEQFDAIARRLTGVGHWALLLIAVLGLLIQLVAATQFGGTQILWGLAWLVALPLLQYVAVQFMDAPRSMVTNNRTNLGSEAFLRCYALVALVAAVASVVAALVKGYDLASFWVLLSGLGVTVLWLASAWLALNPSLLGIRVNRQASAGEEAIGVLSFFMKSLVRIVPIFYGVTLLVAAVQAVALLLGMIGDSAQGIRWAVTFAQLGIPVVLTAVLAPFIAYVAFMLFFLVIDLMRGILRIPGSMGRSGGGGSRGGGARKKSAAKKTATSKKKASASASSATGSAS